MYNLMKTGAVIEVKPFAKGTETYCPAKFWMKDGDVWSSSPCVGTFKRPEMTEEHLTEHLTNMVTEGFQIVVHVA